jgi:hypothetical protein
MASTIVIQTQPQSVSVIVGQDTTFTVVPSSNFIPSSYAYQWRVGGVAIAGATSSSYSIDPVIGDGNKSFTVSVSALSSTAGGFVSVANVTSNAAVLTVSADAGIFKNFAVYPETGEQRFLRLRNLGYV